MAAVEACLMTGQLSLFKSSRQRGTKAPPASEFATHCAIADTLRVSLSRGWLWWHTPNGGARPAFVNKHGRRISVEGGKLARMGTRKGVSDFLLIGPPAARLHALELKARGETPDDDQVAFLEAVEAAGGVAAWCDSYDRAISLLKSWGAVRVSLERYERSERRLIPYAGKDPNEQQRRQR